MTGSITCGLIANALFLVFHPAWASSYPALLQSLGINLVIFVAPALPLIGAGMSRDSSLGFEILRSLIVSLAVFIGVLIFFRLVDWPLTADGAWNATWAATCVVWLVAWRRGVRSERPIFSAGRPWLLFVSLFLGSYSIYLYGAMFVVPEQYDHDLEVQATGYGLLTRFEPLLLTDRGTIYYFAHPPVFHYYVAASFLYYDQLDHLKGYDDASRRALAARQGKPFEPPSTGFRRVTTPRETYVRHEIVGVQDGDYLISPPLPDGKDRMPVEELELGSIYGRYTAYPHKLESRTPAVFLAALTVALLGCWAAQLSGQWWAALFAAAAYATSPEVFVRSSYGGYFAISNFALLLMLLATAYDREPSSKPKLGAYGLAAGLFAAWSDHKLVLFPLALVLWQALRARSLSRAKAAFQPVVIGFAAGTALFWIYGSLVDPQGFWLDHVRTHLLDRMLHHNPLGYSDYPGVAALWIEFWRHTGYLLLPLAVVAFSSAVVHRGGTERSMLGLWGVYALITALVFSWADWRMTKHLMALLPVLALAPLLWAGTRPKRLALVSAAFAVLLIWNLFTVYGIAGDFSSFRVSPAW